MTGVKTAVAAALFALGAAAPHRAAALHLRGCAGSSLRRADAVAQPVEVMGLGFGDWDGDDDGIPQQAVDDLTSAVSLASAPRHVPIADGVPAVDGVLVVNSNADAAPTAPPSPPQSDMPSSPASSVSLGADFLAL